MEKNFHDKFVVEIDADKVKLLELLHKADNQTNQLRKTIRSIIDEIKCETKEIYAADGENTDSIKNQSKIEILR